MTELYFDEATYTLCFMLGLKGGKTSFISHGRRVRTIELDPAEPQLIEAFEKLNPQKSLPFLKEGDLTLNDAPSILKHLCQDVDKALP